MGVTTNRRGCTLRRWPAMMIGLVVAAAAFLADCDEPPGKINTWVMPMPCCEGITGDVNGDGIDADSLDLEYLADWFRLEYPEPSCLAEVDMNGDFLVDIADMVYLVSYLEKGGPPPCDCPEDFETATRLP